MSASASTRPPGPRHAAFDLDGTLLDDCGGYAPSLPDGLRALRSAGVSPLLITGRPVAGFRRFDPDGVLTGALEHFLLSDGNVLLDRVTGEVTALRRLPAELPDRLVDSGVRHFVVELAAEPVASSRQAALQYARTHGMPRSEVTVATDVRALPGPLVAVTVFPPHPGLSPAVDGLPHDLDTVRAFDACVIRPRGTCKATGLARFLARYRDEPDLSRVVAFGNGYNDACLLASAACGVAVRGADDVAVRNCDRHLTEPLGDFLSRPGTPSALRDILTPGSSTPALCTGAHRRPRVRPPR